MAKKKSTKRKGTTKVKSSTKVAALVGERAPVSKVAKKVKKARSKSDIVGVISESTGLQRKLVGSVLETLTELINLDVGKSGPGVFNVPGLMKIVRVHKPATKARKGINPFTKEPTTFKAKPARNIVKVRALKALKDMVQ